MTRCASSENIFLSNTNSLLLKQHTVQAKLKLSAECVALIKLIVFGIAMKGCTILFKSPERCLLLTTTKDLVNGYLLPLSALSAPSYNDAISGCDYYCHFQLPAARCDKCVVLCLSNKWERDSNPETRETRVWTALVEVIVHTPRTPPPLILCTSKHHLAPCSTSRCCEGLGSQMYTKRDQTFYGLYRVTRQPGAQNAASCMANRNRLKWTFLLPATETRSIRRTAQPRRLACSRYECCMRV